MDYKIMTAPCGRDCFNCLFFLANSDENLRKVLATRLNIATEKANCQGCRDREGKCEVLKYYGLSGKCKIYQCVRGKNHEFCYECSDFPCALLQPLADRADRFPHNMKVYNLYRIRNVGIEKWAREEAKISFDRYYQGNLSECVG